MKKKFRDESKIISLQGLGVYSYSETIQYLYDRLPVFHQIGGAAYKPGLENTIRLVNALKNPQNNFKTIHIAGTNGKGSVSHMLAAILQEAGYKTGLYTSPHLVDFRERIRVNGEMIEQQYVVDFVENNKNLFDEIEPSFFEATMAMAFNYFAFRNVDVAVIEVGLGGRLDSTNIIQPELSVITNISFDHVGFLGNTLEKIAFEKAGIIKKHTPVVIGEALPETRSVFVTKAELENAPIYFAEEMIQVTLKNRGNNKMNVITSDNRDFTVGLTGNYQLKNIATTLVSVEQLKSLDFKISDVSLQNGIENVVKLTGLQGRWQEIQQSPKIIVDTGHNVAGISYVVEQLKNEVFKTLHFVIGMVNDKDINAVLSLLPKNAIYYFTQANIQRALPALELKEIAQKYDLSGMAYNSVKQAVESAVGNAEPADFVFIGGSNFIVGEALNCFI